MGRLFTQFSFPGGIPSATWRRRRPARSTRAANSGYSLSHAYGAALDNPDLVVACVDRRRRGRDRPAGRVVALEQVPRPGRRRRGPADPAPQRLQDRQPDGAGPHRRRRTGRAARPGTATSRTWSPATTRPPCTSCSPRPWTRSSTRSPRSSAPPATDGVTDRPRWPMIVLRTPKGWTGPEGGRRPAGGGHLARPPGAAVRRPRRRRAPGRAAASGCAPTGRRSSSTPTAPRGRRSSTGCPAASCGCRRQPAHQRRPATRATWSCPTSATTASRPARPPRPTRVLGGWLRDVMTANEPHRNFRLVGPDETESNRLGAVLEVTGKAWQAARRPGRPAPRTGTAGSWRSCPSTPARAGWRATCSPAGTACSPATRRSSTSSTRWSTSTPSG